MSLSSRIAEWMIELQEYEYTFKVEDSVRAQLADLLTYHLHEKEIKVPNVKASPPPPKLLSRSHTLFFDGAYRKASQKAGGGLVFVNPEGEIEMEKYVILPKCLSNNEAKYDTLILGLEACVKKGIKKLMVKGDALLMVKQVLDIWVCKSKKLRAKMKIVCNLLSQFEKTQLHHISRKENQEADTLTQCTVEGKMEGEVVIMVATLKALKFEGMESLEPVIKYILEVEFPNCFNNEQRKKIIKRASSFLWLEGALYQKGKDSMCRRVPTSKEIPKILQGLHEEVCGGHFSHDLTTRKILQAGYVWPSLHLDVQYWCKICHAC
ncbi:hypothetical protein L7F22_041675 [Adiantum nelumboides]|nr:hypothetical protein [Adiantum nelumboides]